MIQLPSNCGALDADQTPLFCSLTVNVSGLLIESPQSSYSSVCIFAWFFFRHLIDTIFFFDIHFVCRSPFRRSTWLPKTHHPSCHSPERKRSQRAWQGCHFWVPWAETRRRRRCAANLCEKGEFLSNYGTKRTILIRCNNSYCYGCPIIKHYVLLHACSYNRRIVGKCI